MLLVRDFQDLGAVCLPLSAPEKCSDGLGACSIPGSQSPIPQPAEPPGVVCVPGPVHSFCFWHCLWETCSFPCPHLFSAGSGVILGQSTLCRSFCLLSPTSKQNSYKQPFVRLIDMVVKRIDELSGRVLF